MTGTTTAAAANIAGTFWTLAGDTSIDTKCPAGSFCIGGVKTTCSAGKFCAEGVSAETAVSTGSV